MPKNSPAPQGMLQGVQQRLPQLYAQLQQRPQPNIAQMQQRLGAPVDQAAMRARIDAARGRYGQQAVDWQAQDARLAEIRAAALAKAEALRQQQAMQDPNNPQNPNFQFAQAMTQGNSSKNQAPPLPADLGYGGN